MSITIALAGNPNCGKTTLFNALTGSNQFVGNWPGVTVEKKEGKLKKHSDVTVTDLPGIYSLSPYTLEEVVARNYLMDEHPDAILNIIDGTNLERNLYLTTQLTELGIPVVLAINMMDIVEKNGDHIDTKELSRQLGCRIVKISALKGTGIQEAAEIAIEVAKNGKTVPRHTFSGAVEHALAHIEEACVHDMPEEQQRWYAIKIFERDEKVLEKLNIRAGRRRGVHHHQRALHLHRLGNQILLQEEKPRFPVHLGQNRQGRHQPLAGLADLRGDHVSGLLHLHGDRRHGSDRLGEQRLVRRRLPPVRHRRRRL